MEKIAAKLAAVKKGGPRVTYKLRDWCISRQRYWGTPIPVIYCDACGTVPVPEKDLPVLLPKDVALTGEGGSALAKVDSFVKTSCPKCKAKARRETDTMDTFVESSWYFLRYCSPKFDKGMVDVEEAQYWMPIDQYIGGIEHAVGHLLYCRLFMKLLRDLDILKFSETNEPAVNLLTQGMVCKDGAKMGKSKGNMVDPDDMIATYGADTTRIFLLFAAPPELDLEWSDRGVEGSFRFLSRVWRLVVEWMEGGATSSASRESLQFMHRTIQRVTQDIERMHFNTAIAAMMEYLNHLSKVEAAHRDPQLIRTFLRLLAPFAPHMSEELWEMSDEKGLVFQATWPKSDLQYLVRDSINVAVQVNGKLRQVLEVAKDVTEEDVKQSAKASEKVQAHIAGKQIVKEIYVPGRLLNIVVK
jgi:leucyl-tRNA synthetase